MPFLVFVTKAKNDAWGFQTANNIKANFDYLNTQLELLIVEDGIAIKDSVIPAAAVQASNSPTDGSAPVARSAETGGWKWEEPFDNEVSVFFNGF